MPIARKRASTVSNGCLPTTILRRYRSGYRRCGFNTFFTKASDIEFTVTVKRRYDDRIGIRLDGGRNILFLRDHDAEIDDLKASIPEGIVRFGYLRRAHRRRSPRLRVFSSPRSLPLLPAFPFVRSVLIPVVAARIDQDDQRHMFH